MFRKTVEPERGRHRSLFSLLRGGSSVVHCQETPEVAQEAIRKESDDEGGCRRVYYQRRHSLVALQEGRAKENKQALVLEQLKGIRFSHLRATAMEPTRGDGFHSGLLHGS
jgi:hypothetical protein